MCDPNDHERPLRVGSLFSGYGGLDLAVEHAFGAETIWFSENNEPVSRVFAHHWPDTTSLGDITTINWHDVPPIDVLCGGFPCQSVSTVGRRAGIAPGTASGLWAHMATAICVLQPEWVVIENVRGLLSAPAVPPTTPGGFDDSGNSDDATSAADCAAVRAVESDSWGLGNDATRPLRAMGRVLADLADLGRTARWVGLPASSVGAPHHRYRIFILAHRQDTVPHAAGYRLGPGRRVPGTGTSETRNDRSVAPDHRPGTERTGWLAEQERRVGHAVVPGRGHLRRWGRYASAVAQWEHITGRSAPAPALLSQDSRPRPSPAFVEWLMGLPAGWVTETAHGLTANQQITALGNAVLPLQAMVALQHLLRRELRRSTRIGALSDDY